MGEVVRLKRKRKDTVRSVGREALADAFKSVGDPSAVAIVTLGLDGRFAVRMAHPEDTVLPIDVYCRARAIIDAKISGLMQVE